MASFRGAIFKRPLDFSNAQFHFTTFEPLYSSAEFHAKPTEFHDEIKLDGCHYDTLRVRWEKFAEHLKYDDAVYAQLEDNFRKIGFFEDADDVYFEHMRKKRMREAENKGWLRFVKNNLNYFFVELSCGYGVRPFRTIPSGLVVIAIFSYIYIAILLNDRRKFYMGICSTLEKRVRFKILRLLMWPFKQLFILLYPLFLFLYRLIFISFYILSFRLPGEKRRVERKNLNDNLKDLGKAFIFSLDVFITNRQLELFDYKNWPSKTKSAKIFVAIEAILGWFLWILFFATYVRSLIAS